MCDVYRYNIANKKSAFHSQTGKYGSSSVMDCTSGVPDEGRFLEEIFDVVLHLTKARFEELEVRSREQINYAFGVSFEKIIFD